MQRNCQYELAKKSLLTSDITTLTNNSLPNTTSLPSSSTKPNSSSIPNSSLLTPNKDKKKSPFSSSNSSSRITKKSIGQLIFTEEEQRILGNNKASGNNKIIKKFEFNKPDNCKFGHIKALTRHDFCRNDNINNANKKMCFSDKKMTSSIPFKYKIKESK